MPETVASTVEHIRTELRKVIVGQDDAIEQILIALLAEGHALVEGVPGTAKTLTVKTLSRIINATFSRIQFTPDLMPSDITGTNVFNIATSNFNLRRGPIFTDLLLADEINRTPPKKLGRPSRKKGSTPGGPPRGSGRCAGDSPGCGPRKSPRAPRPFRRRW